MKIQYSIFTISFCVFASFLQAQGNPTLEQIKATGTASSKYLKPHSPLSSKGIPNADLEGFKDKIKPILASSCIECHGPDKQKAKFRIDELDPDLVHGEDAEWWLEVMDVMSNGEMPPPDEDVEISDVDRAVVIDWLSEQVLVASKVKRSEGKHSSFRRMTRYEFNYALQDILGLPKNFAADLPPETISEDGFQNSSEMLQMTSQQFTTYRDIARAALKSATVRGPQPKPVYFSITMEKAKNPYYMDWVKNYVDFYKREKEIAENDSDILGRFKDALEVAEQGPRKPGDGKSRRGGRSRRGGYFLDQETGEGWNRSFPNGFSIWKPTDKKPVAPERQSFILALPHGAKQGIDLGNYLPDQGVMKIRIRASRASAEGESYPSLALSFGYNPNNNSSHEFALSKKDVAITAPPEQPQFYEWLIRLDEIQRNPFLRTGKMGQRPTPTEYIGIRNVHQGPEQDGATVHIDYIEITAPYITEWPPASHRQIFSDLELSSSEESEARKVLMNFMSKAWRRPIEENELARKVALFQTIRPTFDNFQEAMVEVLATVLSSPHFLYLTQSKETLTPDELATRLSFFLWSSQPDKELLESNISEPGVLAQQAERMLADPRAKRFVQHFTHQWLGYGVTRSSSDR